MSKLPFQNYRCLILSEIDCKNLLYPHLVFDFYLLFFLFLTSSFSTSSFPLSLPLPFLFLFSFYSLFYSSLPILFFTPPYQFSSSLLLTNSLFLSSFPILFSSLQIKSNINASITELSSYTIVVTTMERCMTESKNSLSILSKIRLRKIIIFNSI